MPRFLLRMLLGRGTVRLGLLLGVVGCLNGGNGRLPQAAGLENVAAAADLSPVEAGREALGDSPRYPWYDRQADELRRIDVATNNSDTAGNRDSGWEDEGTSTTANAQNLSFLGNAFWTFMQVLAWSLLVIVLAGVVALLVWAFMRSEAGMGGGGGESEISVHRASDVDRVESLPFQVKRPHSDLLAEARRHYEQGNFGEAIVYLFSYQLVQLDKRQVIHLTKGKTNRQYLREVRRRPRLFQVLETTMIAFEDVFFGHHELQRDRFETCWRDLDEFHRQLEQGTS